MFWVVGTLRADKLPPLAIVGDIEIDILRKEYPGKREVEEVETDFVDGLATAEVDDGVEGVAIEAEPRVAVVEDAGTAVGESLGASGKVLAVGLVEEGDGAMACKVRLEPFGQEIVDVGAVLLQGIAHFV